MKSDTTMRKRLWSSGAAMLAAIATHVAVAATPAQDPLFLQQPVSPLMMLNMSNDHQLFFKLYDDYSDVDGDGTPDTTYVRDNDYFGYFDSDKCYLYSTGDNRFNPSGYVDANRYCNQGSTSNEWSGNFLNWATMTRMDAVRKILYGGLRSVDTDELTVLRRAMLPNDAHSFTKYYDGNDLDRLTPFTSNASAAARDRGITICNTTDPANRNQLSQNVNDPPLMRVARGNFSLWAANERWQCRWGVERNDNDPALTGIDAYGVSPTRNTHGLGRIDYNVDVAVCDADHINATNNENCQSYGETQKPTGLLQEYGEDGSILFGLMTGSYSRNKSGGVLRKNIGSIDDEINAEDGTFVEPQGNFNGIIDTLNRLRIYGYRFDNGTYHGSAGSDNCLWAISQFNDGSCSNWGNPQSEIFLESLRYLSGLSASEAFDTDDSGRISGLNTADWIAPVNEDNYCAPLSVVQFNASTSSYDWDQLDGASDIGIGNLSSVTDEVGRLEGLYDGSYFIGEVVGGEGDSDDNQLCTAKSFDGLSDVRGTCPDAPRLEGSYQIAGLAYHARSVGIPLQGVSSADTQTVRTFGVALAPAVPSITVPVPNKVDQTINIQPACRDRRLDPEGNCSIVDFKIVEQNWNETSGERSGTLYVNWEDSEQGGDFDQDMWGVIDYVVTETEVSVTTRVIAQSSGGIMGFGYVISGTRADGFHVHSGINNFTFPSDHDEYHTCRVAGDCTCRSAGEQGVCNVAEATTHTYSIGSSDASPLEQPLYYAAKWGGYADDEASEGDIASGEPDSYFFATDPRDLQASLRSAFDRVQASVGSAASVATESTNLTGGEFVFQARFNSTSWTGEMRAYEISDNGEIDTGNFFTTDDTMFTSDGAAGRQVYTLGGNGNITTFTWNNLSDTQQEALNAEDGRGQDRLNWLRGDNSNESASGGLRDRSDSEDNNTGRLLGDIVNSSPVYLGSRDRGYSQLGGDAGSRYADYLETKRAQPATLFVGANDGMLHAFDVENNMLTELFAYVPGGVYPKLAALTDPNYGRSDRPHQYTVDGPLASGDAYINEAWRSVVVGTLGAGGKGVFALDVTNRDNPQVLFEINGADDDGLGYVLGQPMIARMANGRWAAVFGNGYGSSDNTSQLYIVDLEDPENRTEVIDTGAGTGLSAVSLLGDPYGRVQLAYAGDLQGNLWKFDLTHSNSNQWDTAFGDDPLFVARDDDNNVQPITGAPTLGRNRDKNNALMVYFGTGKYFETVDNTTPASPRHSVYAIADLGAPYTGDRNTFLNERHINETATSREVASSVVLDWTTHDGWYLDFDTRDGERVIAKPLLVANRLIFPTIIPSDIACDYGGQSWLMDLPATGDKFTDVSDDDSTITNIPFDSLILGDITSSVLNPTTLKLLVSTSKGELMEVDRDLEGGLLGRQSWRQIR